MQGSVVFGVLAFLSEYRTQPSNSSINVFVYDESEKESSNSQQ